MKILIGPIAYEVVEVAELFGPNGPLCGDIDNMRSRIRIAADMDGQAKLVTLWHEIVHGILMGAGFAQHDEQLVDAIAYGILQVLRDNPYLAPTGSAS